MKIVGIIGYAGSGKGTVADVFTEDSDAWKKFSYADPLKDAVSVLFGWPRHLLEGDTAESREFREKVNDHWSGLLGIPGLTPRHVLQQFGSEVVRESFHDEFWVRHMESRLSFEQLSDTPKNVVIPDCRFMNEALSIRNGGGVIIKVKNPFQVMTKTHEHISEKDHKHIIPNYLIWNTGTLDELRQKARGLKYYIEKGLESVPLREDDSLGLFEEYDATTGNFLTINQEMIDLKSRG